VWLDELGTVAAQVCGDLLDVGAGTGLLTAVMKRVGFRVTALEPSMHMIQQGLSRDSILARNDFVLGGTEEVDLFEDETFDWIVSRQVLCHLAKPERAFSAWYRWLRFGGHLFLVDGFWPRTSWSDAQADAQPFASPVSTQPLIDALSEAGFAIIRSGPFAEQSKSLALANVDRPLSSGRTEAVTVCFYETMPRTPNVNACRGNARRMGELARRSSQSRPSRTRAIAPAVSSGNSS